MAKTPEKISPSPSPSSAAPVAASPTVARPHCGLVMPISAIDGCTEQHWGEVKEILIDALDTGGFDATLVSDADDVGIIQKRIIQNLYENPIVVCDVSGKNPNVMFELGMRLAFDKPTIIVKDDKTTYSFDTSPIEHLEYPRDLRFGKIVDFKTSLSSKVRATYERSRTDAQYTTFLKHFGTFSVAQLPTTEVSREDFMIEELRELRRLIIRRDRIDRDLSSSDSISRRERGRLAIKDAVREGFERIMQEKGSLKLPEMEAELLKDVTTHVDGPAYFRGPDEFESAIRTAIRDLLD